MENGVFFFRNLVNLPICKYFGSVVVVMGGGGGGGDGWPYNLQTNGMPSLR